MPLVGAAAVELQHKDVVAAAVSMERDLSGRAVPDSIAISRDIDVSAAVYGNAIAAIYDT